MYLAARSWEIQPSEFWEMTVQEWMLEAHWRWEQTPEGRHAGKKDEWLGRMELTDDEWWAQNGTPKN